jgi:hypothetical protein
MDESWLAVPVAARELGISDQRVRSLLDSGALRGRKVGQSWLIDPQDVQRRAAHGKQPGRPLSANNAWLSLLLLAAVEKPLRDMRSELSKLSRSSDGWPKIALRFNQPAHIPTHDISQLASAGMSGVSDVKAVAEAADLMVRVDLPARVDAKDRSRLRSLLADIPGPDSFARLVKSRADIRRVRAHPGLLDRALADNAVSVGGGDAVASLGGGVAAGGGHRVYIPSQDVEDYLRRYRLADDVEGNIDIAVIPDSVDPELRPDPGAPVPLSVAWADLLDDPDSRARNAARDWVNALPRPLAIADGRRR